MNYLKYGIVLVVGAALGFVGYSLTHGNIAGSSISTATSTTFSTAKVAEFGVSGVGSGSAVTNGNSSWGSVVNTDSGDRLITDCFFAVTGLETNNNITLLIATSTLSNSTSVANSLLSTNVKGPLDVYTFTNVVASAATTTPKIWPSGQYIGLVASSTIVSGTSTSAATGVAGCHYLAE